MELEDFTASERAVGKHAPDGALNHLDRELLDHDLRGTSPESLIGTSLIVVVVLGQTLVASQEDLAGVSDDDVVTAIDGRSVIDLVLTHQNDGNLRSEPSKGDASGIDHIPLLTRLGSLLLGYLCSLSLHCFFKPLNEFGRGGSIHRVENPSIAEGKLYLSPAEVSTIYSEKSARDACIYGLRELFYRGSLHEGILAIVAQLVEQLIRNQPVASSILVDGTMQA